MEAVELGLTGGSAFGCDELKEGADNYTMRRNG